MRVKFSTEEARACISRWEPFNVMQSGVLVTIADTIHVSQDGKTVGMIDLALFLSKGGINSEGRQVPARPFVIEYSRENKDWLLDQVYKNLEWRKRRTVQGTKYSHLNTYYCVLHTKQLASIVRQHFQQWVRNGNYYKAHVPNAPYTIEKKGSDVPLVDTGQLANAIIAKPVTGVRGGRSE